MVLPQTNSQSTHDDDVTTHADVDEKNSASAVAIEALNRGFCRLAGLDVTTVPLTTPLSELDDDPTTKRGERFGWTVMACAVTTAIAVMLRDWLNPVNLVMLYLLTVVLVSVRFGQRAGIVGSFLAVLAFDVFLVPPYYSFTVADTEYVITFAIMLVVSLIISHLTASLRQQVLIAYARERRAQSLFKLSKELSGALTREQISEISARHVQSMFQADVFLLLSNDNRTLLPAIRKAAPSREVMDTAQRIFDCLESGKVGAKGLTLANVTYLPLRAPVSARGILILSPQERALLLVQEQERLLQTVCAQIALAVERVHYIEVAQATTMAMESERLRNSLLSAISHDVRTPLTAIVGMASTLAENRSLPAKTQDELVLAIQDNAHRMSNLVSNLLDMARLHAGNVVLNRQWHMLEEVIGSALALSLPALDKYHLTVAVPPELPLLEFDAVLIERVLCNLLDNAVKYAADGQTIHIAAERQGDSVHIAVEDSGPGLPIGMEETIFQKFVRVQPESAQSGVGLGLSICRTIVEAHHGRIWGENRPEGGARFVFSLSVGSPPVIDGIGE